MKKLVLVAAAVVGLSGCESYGGYGTGVSIGYGSSYGYGGGYGYNRYGGGYGRDACITYDRYGRAYYSCGYGGYSAANRYVYSPRTVVYYYPGYTYRNGYYYDGYNRRYDGRSLYYRHYRNRRH